MTQESPHGFRERLEELFSTLRQGTLYLRRLFVHKLVAKEIVAGKITARTTDIEIGDTIKVDHIEEYTSAHGINIDGVDIKDSNVAAPGYVGIGASPATAGALRLGHLALVMGKTAGGSNALLFYIGTGDKFYLGGGATTVQFAAPLELVKTSRTLDTNGEITLVSQTSYIQLDPYDGAASDTLEAIVAGQDGQVAFLTPRAGKDITLKHNGTPTSGVVMMLNGGADYLLDQDHDMATAVYDSSSTIWKVSVPHEAHDHSVAADGQALAPTSVVAASYVAVGTNPAGTGVIRIPNSQQITAMNAAGNGDRVCLYLGADDKMYLGSGAALVEIVRPIELAKTSLQIDSNGEISLAEKSSWCYLESEAGASDALEAIATGGGEQVVWLTPKAGHDITLKHDGTASDGNHKVMMINGEADYVLDQDHDMAFAIYDVTAGVWNVMVPGVRAHGPSDHTEFANWKVIYTDGSGDQQELALGADGEVLTSTGASSAPAFEAAAGGNGGGISSNAFWWQDGFMEW